MKTIAIQDGLETLKTQLADSGYNVVSYNELQSPVDACIYYEENNNQSLQMVNQFLNATFSSIEAHAPANSGTLLINAKGKTIEEIRQIIDTRVYSPLF